MRIIFVLSFVLSFLGSIAQVEHTFKDGLVLPNCYRYGREALGVDQLAYRLYSGQLGRPSENLNVFVDDKGADVSWQAIKTDSSGKFRDERMSNGYIFLSYQSAQERYAILNISGNSMVYVNGAPHGGDIYGDGWMNIPVKLNKGNNELLVRCNLFSRRQGVSAKLSFADKNLMLNVDDATLPHIVLGQSPEQLTGAVVVINATDNTHKNVTITSTLDGKSINSRLATISQGTIRKTGFKFDASSIRTKGDYECVLTLRQDNKVLDEKRITITAVGQSDHQSYTFTSEIDGSIQYYSVAPSTGNKTNPALFLSVHGAGVQAIGQARAYAPKDWGVLVAPTNRRPRGFNWEDWGRIDALEVLELAKLQFKPDLQRIYLTGHSMGGHGTWYLGATYPDKWAAIAPCAGYPTLTGYGSADGKIPNSPRSESEKILLRASNSSNVVDLAANYKDLGVYVHHGDADEVVSVDYARQMRKVLSEFHGDFNYYEYPGGSHWFGNESVDWKPIFEYFKWHKIESDTAVNEIDFITANPAISSQYRWASIIQQVRPLDFSKFHLSMNKKLGTISGSTHNVSTLKIKIDFIKPGDSILLNIDSVSIKTTVNAELEVLLAGYPKWIVANKVSAKSKNATRSGTFKEAFNHRMVFVYGTHGSASENTWAYNKARYDAEVWYYRGNGSLDIIRDDEFTPGKYKDRGVILFGNSVTNSAWNKLLIHCPIKVNANTIQVGDERFAGTDLGIYFTWPREDSDVAMVAAVSGTGLMGMKATNPNQYFSAGSGFPDYFVFSADMLTQGVGGIKTAGFFDNDWKLQSSK